jgi:hypothetical protein
VYFILKLFIKKWSFGPENISNPPKDRNRQKTIPILPSIWGGGQLRTSIKKEL